MMNEMAVAKDAAGVEASAVRKDVGAEAASERTLGSARRNTSCVLLAAALAHTGLAQAAMCRRDPGLAACRTGQEKPHIGLKTYVNVLAMSRTE
jgi:hypothetical protein